MPALANPRHEAFACAIVQGLSADTRHGQAASTAYREAGYLAKPGNSAEAAASRLLSRVRPILDRVNEIQAAARARTQVSLESIAEELNEARALARETKSASAMTAATMGKAKLFGLEITRTEQGKPGDFSNNQSTYEIAAKVLADAGAAEPSPSQIAMAQEELARHARAIEAIASEQAAAGQA